jgi:uncharacterized membrane protein
MSIPRLKRYFVTGFLAIIPVAATVGVVIFCIRILNKVLGIPLSKLINIEGFLASCVDLVTGIMLALIVIIGTGYLAAKIGERGIFKWIEGFVAKVPIISSLYTSVKQLVDIVILNKTKGSFTQVVLVEYPRKGIYSVGFVTSKVNPEMESLTKRRLLNLYVPTALNIASGFLIIVPEEDVIPLNISVEEGLKLVISGGIIVPKEQNLHSSQRVDQNHS